MTNPRAKQTSARAYRHGLKKMAPELLELVKAQALAGCVQSQTLLLNRIVPPLRSTIGGLENSIQGISFKEQALGLIALALKDGADLSHTQAAMDLLKAGQGVIEASELEARLTALEQTNQLG